MNQVALPKKSWQETIRALAQPSVLTMLFLGISAGIPLLLIFSSLSLWLREAGVEKSSVTYFSWAALGYSFKFVWAPLIDQLPVPFLTQWLGRRRAWLLTSQLMIMLSIAAMASVDPAVDPLNMMAWATVFLGFSSATQDIVVDAYRIESANNELQALMSSSYIAGYRIGMLLAGAGALFLASYFGSTMSGYSYSAWQWTYLIMSGLMLTGMITTFIISEPTPVSQPTPLPKGQGHLGFLALFLFSVVGFIGSFYFSSDYVKPNTDYLTPIFSNKHLASFVVELVRLAIALTIATLIAKLTIASGIVKKQMVEQAYIVPIKDFFNRFGWSLAWMLLALISLYRISDILLGVISNIFYQDLGFTKPEIASVVKSFGLLMTIVGGFLGGILSIRFGVLKILFLGALLSALTNLLFMMLAAAGHDMTMLMIVISADNLSAGLASAAFIAFLSSLTNISFTAVQYAIFSSLMTLLPKILGGYSGGIVKAFGYSQFFLITALMGIPVLLLILWTQKYFKIKS
ncbi:MAG: MFS transporter [Methylococcales bacterium]|nr:MFS transporter [Methylococcales bacterium]